MYLQLSALFMYFDLLLWLQRWAKSIMFFHRYAVLLTQRLCEASDREQTVALLDMVGAEEGHYQLGLTKVPSCAFMMLTRCFYWTFPQCSDVCLNVWRCSLRSFCTSYWRKSGAALRPGLPSPSRGTSGASSAGGTSGSSNRKPSSSRATSADTRPGTERTGDDKSCDKMFVTGDSGLIDDFLSVKSMDK